MLELLVEDGATQQFRLLPAQRVTRDGRAPLSQSADATLELTTPLVTPITESLTAYDPELLSFWKAEQGRFRYDYVTLRATFRNGKASALTRAWVEVRLNSGTEGGAIAWSMSPARVVDSSKIKNTGKLGIDFKLVHAEMGGEQESTMDSWFLRAWREHTESPFWEFKETGSTPIEGTFRLHLVTRTAYALAVEGKVTARAVVDRRSFLIFRETDDAIPATVDFHLEREPPSQPAKGG